MHTLRMAIRALRSTPAVSAIVVFTLALAIGANTAIFSVVNSLLLRTLPVPEPGRLVTISSDYALAHGFKAGVGWNYEMWTRLLQLPPVFDGVLMWSQPTFNLAPSGEKEPARTLLVSGSFFTTLGVQPRVGRLLTVEDDVRGGGKDGPVAVISHRLWQERFGGAADTIGRSLTLDGVPFTIVGVTPAEFLGIEVGQAFDVAVPLGTEPLILGKRSAIDERRSFTFVVLVRLKPGQSLEAATTILRSIQPAVLGVAPERLADVRPPFLREPFVAVAAPTGRSDFLRVQYRAAASDAASARGARAAHRLRQRRMRAPRARCGPPARDGHPHRARRRALAARSAAPDRERSPAPPLARRSGCCWRRGEATRWCRSCPPSTPR